MRISPQDTLLDLGTLCPGEQRTLSMHFRNPGSAAQRLSITASAHFAVSASTIDIESGSTGGFDVRFEALAGQGSIRESILVTDECGIVHQVRCAAKVLAPRLTYTGDGSFHSLPGDTVSRQLLLRNPSSLDIRILTAIVGDARFALAAPTPPFTVASGSGTLLNIRFLSTVPDSVSTELRLDGTPCGAAIAIPVSGTTEEVAATLGCPSISARVDTTVTIPINLLSSANLAARGARTVRIRLAFNRTLLLPVEARATDSLSSGVIVGDSIRGEERIVDIRLMGRKAPSPGTILLLDCLTGLGNAESTPLRISADWMGAYVRTTYSHGEFHSLGLCSQGGLRLLSIPPALILHDVYPNPLTGRTATVSFTVTGDNPEPAPVRISLIGLFGKEVLVTDALFTAGRHLLELNAATVPEGAYVLRMESGGRSAQRRVIILR
jgi:hypothetical protein